MSFTVNSRYCFVAFLLLLLPSAVSAADIQINSTCVFGACPPPVGPSDALQYGQSIGLTNVTYLLTFANTDAYSIALAYSASYTAAGTAILVNPNVTYTGAAPSVGNDVIAINFFQNYYDNSPGSWDGAYTETIPLALSGNVGAGSTVSAQLFYNGQGLGLVGPFGPGYHFGQNTVNLTGLTPTTLTADYQFTFNFNAGTLAGANASSPTPEPWQALPLGLALLGLWGRRVVVRRRNEL